VPHAPPKATGTRSFSQDNPSMARVAVLSSA
jgi:hypothetical protein